MSSYKTTGTLTNDHTSLLKFMNFVFSYCGTYSLKYMCKQKNNIQALTPGDILVKAGSPGHAMMVADVAYNPTTGKQVFMLLQSYMPAQDIHIVHNLNNDKLSPWYEVNTDDWIQTPTYLFEYSNLREW